MLNKKGVSPLIATILLIAFAVSLGAVIMNWGRNLEINKPDDKCGGIEIKIRKTDNYQACYKVINSSWYINFILDNAGNVDIDGLGIWLIGEKGTQLHDIDNRKIKKGELLDINDKTVPYDFKKYGNIKHVQLIPKIKSEDSIEICTKNSIKAKEIGICD